MSKYRKITGRIVLTVETTFDFEVTLPKHITEDQLLDALQAGGEEGVDEFENGNWDNHLFLTSEITDEEYNEMEFVITGRDDTVDDACVTFRNRS